jgi:hypothetical protein
MGDNAKRHNNRWQGLIPWWQQVFGRVDESAGEPSDMINSERPDAAPTPLPPDRPLGAAPERLEDAAQEFLTDWLVRHEYEQALAFLSPRAYACLNLEDTGSNKPLDAAAARRELRKLMEYSAGKVGPVPNLTSAIVAFTPRDPQRVVVDQPFRAGVPGDTASGSAGPHVSVRTQRQPHRPEPNTSAWCCSSGGQAAAHSDCSGPVKRVSGSWCRISRSINSTTAGHSAPLTRSLSTRQGDLIGQRDF